MEDKYDNNVKLAYFFNFLECKYERRFFFLNSIRIGWELFVVSAVLNPMENVFNTNACIYVKARFVYF